MKLLLFILFTVTLSAQTIVLKETVQDSVLFGRKLDVEGAYNYETEEILFQNYYYDYDAVHVLLHELGHHIWFYGGIDTTAILTDLVGKYFDRNEVIELFAEQHWKYFFGSADSAFSNIFYKFYHR